VEEKEEEEEEEKEEEEEEKEKRGRKGTNMTDQIANLDQIPCQVHIQCNEGRPQYSSSALLHTQRTLHPYCTFPADRDPYILPPLPEIFYRVGRACREPLFHRYKIPLRRGCRKMHQYRGLMCREDRKYNSVTLVWVRMCVRNIQCIDLNKTTESKKKKEKGKEKG
jgi:hypothetical protein